jgi:site-specific DNA recombinase
VRAAVYLRQSQDQENNRLAITRQREDCYKLCAQRGWTATEFSDNNISASTRRPRPAYRRMLNEIGAGHFDAVVVWDLDRLYRQPRELEDFIDLADKHRLALATVTGDCDLSTDNGRLYARIKGAVAKAEGERKAARWKRSNEQKALAGQWTPPPNRCFGYNDDGTPREPEASAIRAAVVDVLAGKSLRRISIDWNESGLLTTKGTKWNNPRVRRVLMNPRHAGLVVLRGQVVPGVKGDWTPIIDEDMHNGLVATLSDESRRIATTFERKYQGSGVYYCGRCGGPMRAFSPTSGGRAYVCREKNHLVRRGEPLDNFVTAQVLERLSRPDAHVLLDNPEVDLPELQNRRAALVARKDELGTLYGRGVIDGAQFERASVEVRAQLAEIDAQLAEAARTSPVAALLADVGKLTERWEQMSPAHRGQAIQELCTVTVLPCPKGQRRFDSKYVRVEWRSDAD